MFVVVVPQVYLELNEKMPGFDMPAWAFYQRYLQGGDIYCVRPHDCIDAPTWNHLWFVAYLWLYTLLACGLAKCIPTSAKAHWVSLSEKYLGGLATLLVPMCLLVLARVWLYPLFDSTHDLDDDWYNHAQYGVAFVTGLAIAFNERAWHTIYAARRWMTVLWAICYLTFLACFLVFDSDTGSVPALALATQRALWGVMTWAAICAITGYAMRWRHTDSRWRAWLTEAVFPLYILHQTVIILLAWNVRSLHLPWLIEYVALIALTFCICFAAFGLIRRVPWLRPFFGLRFRLAGGVAPSIARHHPRANHPAPIDRQA
jgi:peptidoglycan/LPS O-acetylase OafA/YrhL